MAATYTYATRAAFDTALASGGALATLLNSVTSSNPTVAAVAYITESGESFPVGTNVMVDIKSVGPGDAVLYDTTNGKFFGIVRKWIDNNYPYPPTQATHIMIESVLDSRFVVCGICIRKKGGKLRIAGRRADKPWTQNNTSDYAWQIPTSDMPNYSTVMKKAGTNTTAFNGYVYNWPSTRYQEWYYGIYSRSNQWLPVLRSDWDSLVAASTDGTITFTWSGGSATVNLKDYDWSYDTFIKKNFQAMPFPASGAFADKDGRFNTKTIYNWLKTNKSESIANGSAAGYCYNYTPVNKSGTAVTTIPNLRAHEWYLGAIRDVAELCELRHTLLTAISWGSGYLWSSTQYSAYFAWYVRNDGSVRYNLKYYLFSAVPLADLPLNF